MIKLNAKKLAQYFFDLSHSSTHLDILVIYSLLENPDYSPTDIHDYIYGVRRGGAVDKTVIRG